MRINKPLIISIGIHIIIILCLFLYLPINDHIEEEKRIKVDLIVKKDKNMPNSRDINSNNVDTIEEVEDVVMEAEAPVQDKFLTQESVADLVIKKTVVETDIKPNGINVNEFEASLIELAPDIDVDLFNEDRDSNIKWSENEREILTNSSIDFASFPETSFTGVGVTVLFSVDRTGDVFNISIKPPGSGSLEFDILVQKYVSNFKFNKSNEISDGELTIVYQK